jgi:hypothetical protein
MWFKKYIQIKVYRFYLKGISIDFIALHVGLSEDDTNEIIDYINTLYH